MSRPAVWLALLLAGLAQAGTWDDGITRGDSTDGSRYRLAETLPRFTFGATAVALDAAGAVYVADAEQCRVIKFAADGKLLAAWGRPGSGRDQLRWPRDVAVDAAGRIYVADSGNNRVVKLAADGRWLGAWGPDVVPEQPQAVAPAPDGTVHVVAGQDLVVHCTAGGRQLDVWRLPARDEFDSVNDPRDLVVDRAGRVWVLDCYHAQLQRLDRRGRVVQRISLEGYVRPRAVAMDAGGCFYLADRYESLVRKLDPSGQLLATFGEPSSPPRIDFDTWQGELERRTAGQLSSPSGVAVDARGQVYVADRGNSRVAVFAPDGRLTTLLGGAGGQPGQFNHPYGLACDGQDQLYVADGGNDRVQVFDKSGRPVTAWGTRGKEPGQFDYASQLALDPAGRVYVVDAGNHRLQWFSPTGQFVGQLGEPLDQPWGVAAAADGWWVTDKRPGLLRHYSAAGQALDNGEFVYPTGVVLDGAGRPLVSDFQRGVVAGDKVFAAVDQPLSLTRDRHGNVYVVDRGRTAITKLSPSGQRLASWGLRAWLDDPYGGDDYGGRGWKQFAILGGLAVDSADNVYLADTWRHRILRFAPVAAR